MKINLTHEEAEEAIKQYLTKKFSLTGEFTTTLTIESVGRAATRRLLIEVELTQTSPKGEAE